MVLEWLGEKIKTGRKIQESLAWKWKQIPTHCKLKKKKISEGCILRIAIWETQTPVTLKECSGEEKESGTYKDKKPWNY